MASLIASGTTTTDGTEQTLRSETTTGIFVLILDRSAMLAGDIVEVRGKTIILSAGALGTLWMQELRDAPPTDDKIFESMHVISNIQADWTIKRTAGTDRAYPWKVMAA